MVPLWTALDHILLNSWSIFLYSHNLCIQAAGEKRREREREREKEEMSETEREREREREKEEMSETERKVVSHTMYSVYKSLDHRAISFVF